MNNFGEENKEFFKKNKQFYILNTATLFFVFIIFSISLWHEGSFLYSIAKKIKWPIFIITVPILFLIRKGTLSNPLNITSILLGLFLFVILFSTLTSDFLDNEGVQYLVGYSLLFIFAFFLQVGDDAQNTNSIIFRSLFFSSLICLVISYLLIVAGSGWANGRFRGIFHNTNALGSVSSLLLIASFMKYNEVKSRIYLVIVIMAIVAVLLTQSRGALLGLIICSAIYLYKNKNWKAIIYSLIAGTLVYGVSQTLSALSEEQSSEFQKREMVIGIDDSRKLILEKHLELFVDKPYFGQGLSGNDLGGRFPAELAYTDILSFSGMFGFLFFMSALSYCVYIGYKSYHFVTHEAQANFLMFVAVLVMSIGDGYISNIGNPLPIFSWLYMGSISRYRSMM